MDDLFGRLWDRFPDRRSTLKPRTFSVPISDYHHNPPPPPNRPKEHYTFSSKPRNVVSVPVNFVSSDTPKASSNEEKKAVAARPSMDESTAAVKVQKVFRGFLVRKSAPLKNLKIIAKAKAEGEEIRKHISDEKVVDLVRRDDKERLKITEWIMSQLLKLDAIQGVNSVVRELRKATNRELVNLQETVDAIIAGNSMEEEMHKEDIVCSHTEDKPDILDKNEETSTLECLHVNSGEEIKEQDRLDHSKEVEYVDDTELRNTKPTEKQEEESPLTQMRDLQLEGSYETEEFSSKPRNVVSVPVNFVNSDAPKASSKEEKKTVSARLSMDESTAAVELQKVFRGFSVRKSAPLKNLKIIAKAKAESQEIRKHISDEKVVDLVRRSENERLKITEWIMSLLLKLDAIQGVNSVVREFRKATTCELLNLQETVDAIIAGNPMEEEMDKEDTLCSHTEGKPDILDKNEETANLECLHVNSGEDINEEDQLDHSKEVEYVDDTELRNWKPTEMQAEESCPTQMHDLQLEDSYETEELCTPQGTDNNVELEKVGRNVYVSDNGLITDMVETETVQGDDNIKAEDENKEYEEVVDATGAHDTESTREEGTEDIGMVRQENKRLKTMVADLLKKSEKQSQMIDNLSSRICQLEEQVSNKKKIADQRKKTRTMTDIASPKCAGG